MGRERVGRVDEGLFFFFSSRRRHTRWTGDWSSDVCSSDLSGTVLAVVAARLAGALGEPVCKPGVQGLGALMDPVPFLGELSQRGVRAAVFEGVDRKSVV